VSILAFLSGTWFAITSGFLHAFGQFLPSWWLVQARNVALDGHAWGVRGWVTVLAQQSSRPERPGHIAETPTGFSAWHPAATCYPPRRLSSSARLNGQGFPNKNVTWERWLIANRTAIKMITVPTAGTTGIAEPRLIHTDCLTRSHPAPLLPKTPTGPA
jgi:hypothetical protein